MARFAAQFPHPSWVMHAAGWLVVFLQATLFALVALVAMYICVRQCGSPQESDRVPILSGLPANHEFDLGGGHALGFEQEVLKILIPTSTSDQHFDIPVYGFHHSQWRFYPTVVQNPVQVIPEHPRQLFKRLHSLPTELISPGSQVP